MLTTGRPRTERISRISTGSFAGLRNADMLAVVVPAYIGYDCGPPGWCDRMFANGVDRLGQYGRFLGARYRDTPNISDRGGRPDPIDHWRSV